MAFTIKYYKLYISHYQNTELCIIILITYSTAALGEYQNSKLFKTFAIYLFKSITAVTATKFRFCIDFVYFCQMLNALTVCIITIIAVSKSSQLMGTLVSGRPFLKLVFQVLFLDQFFFCLTLPKNSNILMKSLDHTTIQTCFIGEILICPEIRTWIQYIYQQVLMYKQLQMQN